MATGALVGISAPAYANHTLSVNPGSVTIKAGEQAAVEATVSDADPGQTIKISASQAQGVSVASCSNNCEVKGGSGKVTITLRAASNAQPGPRTVTVTAKPEGVVIPPDEKSYDVTVNVQAAPPPAPETVTEVSGEVTDIASGDKLGSAPVALVDGDGTPFEMQADAQGRFKFTPTAAKPITPGQLRLQATKDGYQRSQTITRNGTAGQAVTGIKIALTATATTAPPSETPSTAPATEPAGDESSDEGGGTTNQASDEDSGSMMSWLLIGLGGLLVALGVGAIVLLLMRRGDDGEEDDGEEGEPARPGPRGPLPRPAAAGVYHAGPDPTMVARPGMAGDRTMVTRPALADAPTALHRPAVDEFPDPYNPPRGPQGPYGSPAGYPPPQSPGYGAASAPSYGGAYGSPAGPPVDPYARGPEYGAPSSPTGPAPYGPGPTSGGGYGGYDAGGGYDQGGASGYGGSGGYGAGGDYGAPGGGYDQGGSPGYGAPGGYGAGGDYGAPGGHGAGGGYDQDAGYGGSGRHDQGGYDAGGGYDHGGASGYGGYDQGGPSGYGGAGRHDQGGHSAGPDPRDGYDGYYDDGSRHGPPQQGRGQRRSLDWLDD